MKSFKLQLAPIDLKGRRWILHALYPGSGSMGGHRMRKVLLGLMFLLCAPCLVWASCSGSGLTWNCTAGTTVAQVNTAVSSASNGATITFANGNYTWNSGSISLNGKNGISLVCSTLGACNVAIGNNVVITISSVTSNISNLIRVGGFNFTGTGSGNGSIWFYGAHNLQNIRIDHNTFAQSAGSVGILIGSTNESGRKWGVIDNNSFTGSNNFMGVGVLGGGESDWVAGLMGSSNNLFIEDNTFNFTKQVDDGVGCTDIWSGSSVVVRHNNVHNCRILSHGVCHGGPVNFEVYNNTVSTDDGYRLIHHQGSGEFIVFNNTLSNDHMALLYYRDCADNPEGCGTCNGSDSSDGNRAPSGTYHGYPCYRQPGRDRNLKMMPIYVWNNKVGSSKSDLGFEDAGSSCTHHVLANRDYYNAVSVNAQTSPASPFNGTTGMGFGTLANRPTTCKTTTEVADAGNGGVGYFATDQGSQGTLYMCTATNTWTAHYQPYTYPHPAQGSVQVILPPSGLAIQ
jgi:hypothetical protein